jgi:hypothetical protein
MIPRPTLLATFALAALALPARSQEADTPAPPRPVTDATRRDPEALARLEAPGQIVFRDGFDSPESLTKYFEIQGLREDHSRLDTAPGAAHSGAGALRLTAIARDGRASGVGASAWFGPEGYDLAHFRRYIRFADDYDQGNLNHVGGGLAAVAGPDRYFAMGMAGLKPRGDDYYKVAFEPWRDWRRSPAPGYLFLYAYWMDMARDRDGHYWGNMLQPPEPERLVPKRGRWYCLEHMIKANTPGHADGELAAWVDGKLYLHFQGIRWRSSPEVRVKRIDLGLYVHQATRDNTVWYDDVVVSTGYIGPDPR